MSQYIKNQLNEIKTVLENSKKTFNKIKKYNPSHKYFKTNIDRVFKDIRSIKLRLEKNKNLNKNKLLLEIKDLLNDILKLKKVSIKNSFNIIGKIEDKLQELEIDLEENIDRFEERIYDKGNRFDFHLDMKEIINLSKNKLFIIDSWINEDLFEIYLKNVNPKTNVTILTNTKNPKGKSFIKIGNMFKSQHKGNFEVRESDHCHDRAVFCDNKNCWVIGQSIKDAAKNKPTYLKRINNNDKLESIYQKIFSKSKKII